MSDWWRGEQDDPPPRAKRLLRKGALVVAPLLLLSAGVYAKVLARNRWEGRAPAVGYGDVFRKRAEAESARLKGAHAAWVPFEARTHPTPPTALWGNAKRPFPTGAWWTNLVVGGPSSAGDGLGPAFATPYAVSVLPDKGVALSYGEVLVGPFNDSITLAAGDDLSVSLGGGVAKRYVEAWDDLTMTMRLETKDGAALDALFARGSPYVTFRVNNAIPTFKSAALFFDVVAVPAANGTAPRECAAYPGCTLASLHGDCCPQPTGVDHPCCAGSLAEQRGSVFSAQLLNGQQWRIYFSSAVTLKWDSTGGAATAQPFSGVVRVAVVPSATKKQRARDARMLDAHAEAYATAGDVRVTVDRAKDPNVGIVAFDWQVSYMRSSVERDDIEPALLMLALPHHVAALVADDTIGFLPEELLAYRGGLKGMCRAILGSAWRVAEPLTKIGFAAPRYMTDQKKIDAVKAQVKSDVMRPAGETDSDAAAIASDDWFGTVRKSNSGAPRHRRVTLTRWLMSTQVRQRLLERQGGRAAGGAGDGGAGGRGRRELQERSSPDA